jgi:hypothetical protein
VSLLNSIDRDHVLTAIETWDSVNGSVYFQVRGDVSTHVLLHAGREYDAPSIAGIAHGLATGRTLSPGDIPGGSAGAAKALKRLGFEVRDDSPPAPATARAPRRTTSTRSSTAGTSRSTTSRVTKPGRIAATDRPVTLCPTCYIALPATGICDNCG